jgi:hypothetical protein
MDALPFELKRKIADGCSLATLANLQIASKDWAKACRGVGAKFRKRTIRELYESEKDEIREYVRRNVSAKSEYGFMYFDVRGIKGYVLVITYAKRHCTDMEAVMRYLWRESSKKVETHVFSEAVKILMHPNYVTVPAGIVVRDGVDISLDLSEFELINREPSFFRSNDDTWRIKITVKSKYDDEETRAYCTFDYTVEEAHQKAWSVVDKKLFRRRSSRIASKIPRKRTFEEILCDVDLLRIVNETE